VTAKINGVEVASTITTSGRYGDSPYILDVPDNDGNCQTSAVIDFYIEDRAAGQSMLRTESQEHYVTLDLSANGVLYCGDGSCNNGETCSSCSKDCGSCSSGGDNNGGGGGGGGGGYTPPACTPDWECSPWSQCINGTQSRTCNDLDECDTEEGRPAEEQTCGIESVLPSGCTVGQTTCVGSDVFECDDLGEWNEVETCDKGCDNGSCKLEDDSGGDGNPITGLFLDQVSMAIYGIIALIILAMIYYLWRRRGSSKK
jgi:hypothetical protein